MIRVQNIGEEKLQILDCDAFAALDVRRDEVFYIIAQKNRNEGFSAKFHALMLEVYSNLPEGFEEKYNSLTALKNEAKFQAGLYDEIRSLDGKVKHIVLGSTSFKNMDEFRFRVYYKAVLGWIYKEFGFSEQFVKSIEPIK